MLVYKGNSEGSRLTYVNLYLTLNFDVDQDI